MRKRPFVIAAVLAVFLAVLIPLWAYLSDADDNAGARKVPASLQTGKWWEGSFERGGFTQGMTHGDPTRGGRHGDEGLKIGSGFILIWRPCR